MAQKELNLYELAHLYLKMEPEEVDSLYRAKGGLDGVP